MSAYTPTYDKPLPEIDPYSEGYWELARAHRLSVQACRHCGHLHFPPTPVCPACLSDEQDWRPVSGRGTLVSLVTFHKAYWDGYRNALPYHVCLVQLEEGPLMVGNFGGGAVPDGVKAGMPMRATFLDATPEISLVQFVPA